MQLVAYGAQDIYLTGNPQITFFKVVYRRHTNFSMEAIQQTWDGNSISAGRCTATISRNGDLVHRMYLELMGTTGSTINNGIESITNVEVEIGGQRIDKHSGQWMEVWSELTEPNPSAKCGKSEGGTPVSTGTLFQNMSGMGGCVAEDDKNTTKYFVPFQFWFCRNPGLALPLIALQYHEVKIILNQTFGAAATDFGHGTMTSNNLWCDYIYLDTDERRRFAQVSHEYLIEQVQEQSITTGEVASDLNFNHPVKELIWCVGTTPGTSTNTPINSGSGGTYQLKLNGHDRFAARDWRYFTRTQIWQHHTGVGGLLATSEVDGLSSDGIGVYSFALKPEEHQPSGTCNFSRIDNAQFIPASGSNVAVLMFAVNYNVLRIMSGMGGLAYSN